MNTFDKLQKVFPLVMKNSLKSNIVFKHWRTEEVHPYEALGYTMQALEVLLQRIEESEKENEMDKRQRENA